jgi:hypothetical protein
MRKPKFYNIPEEEYQQRINKAKELLDKYKMDIYRTLYYGKIDRSSNMGR